MNAFRPNRILNAIRAIRPHLTAGVLGLLVWGSGAGAATLTHDTGITTYTQNFSNGSLITVNGGEATFTGTVRTNSQIDITGGTAIFGGTLQNNVVFNISGGAVEVNSLQNNATFNIIGGGITLNQPIGNSASVNISSGELNLGADDVFANNTNVTMDGGTLNTQGNSVSFDSLTLNGDSIIDLGDNPDATIDVGTISGGGTVTFTNFTDATQVSFDANTSTIDVGTQVYFGATPGTVNNEGNIVPAVPEPSTVIGALILVAFLAAFEVRRRHSREKR